MTINLWKEVSEAISQNLDIIVRSDFDDCAARTDLRYAQDALEALEFLPLSLAESIVESILMHVEVGGHEGIENFYADFRDLVANTQYNFLKAGQVYELTCLKRKENTVLDNGFLDFVNQLGVLVWVTANHRPNLFANGESLANEFSVSREQMHITQDKSVSSGPWDLSASIYPGISVCLENSRRNAEVSCGKYPFFLIDRSATDIRFEQNLIIVPSWEVNPIELISVAAAA